tara:strand:+ start:314 stop:613 length:300 start_codon:yes stop_codon:yes gene_type:complete
MHKEAMRFALAMRIGRAALGMSQQEFANALGVAKSTVARNETLDMSMRADTLAAMSRLFKEYGIEIDLLGAADSLDIKVNLSAISRLTEEADQEDQGGK